MRTRPMSLLGCRCSSLAAKRSMSSRRPTWLTGATSSSAGGTYLQPHPRAHHTTLLHEHHLRAVQQHEKTEK